VALAAGPDGVRDFIRVLKKKAQMKRQKNKGREVLKQQCRDVPGEPRSNRWDKIAVLHAEGGVLGAG